MSIMTNDSDNSVLNSTFCLQLLSESPTTCPHYPTLIHFYETFKYIHGPLTIIICLLGIITNIISSIVLAQPKMRNPITLILLAIAILDSIKMLSYSLYSMYLNLLTAPNPCYYPHKYSGVLLILTHAAVSVWTHTASTLLIVTLATFRVITLTQATSGHSCVTLTIKHSFLVIIIITSTSLLIGLLMFFTKQIIEFHPNHYWEFLIDYPIIEQLQFAFFGCIIKISSSVILVILTVIILLVMRQSAVIKQRLLQQNLNRKSDMLLRDNINDDDTLKQRPTRSHHDPYKKASKLLIAIVIFFVLIEFPQGIINTLAAILPCFIDSVYWRIGDLMDTMVLINSTINFILYCIMSQQYRETFYKLFINK